MEKKFYRYENSKKVLGGVAQGLGVYFNIDPLLVRILFIVGAFGGVGILAYIVLWAVVPARYSENTADNISHDINGDATEFEEIQQKISNNPMPYILIGIGTLFLLKEWIPHFNLGKFWPIILIGIGVYQIMNPKKRNQNYISKNVEPKKQNETNSSVDIENSL